MNVFEKIKSFFNSHEKMNLESLSLFEETLYESDMDGQTVQELLRHLKDTISHDKGFTFFDFKNIFYEYWLPLFSPLEKEVQIRENPFVIFLIGINGVGKTTTLGKLAYLFKQHGKKNLLVAADTFRAAACEQLLHWGETLGVDVFSRGQKNDPSSVIFDALKLSQEKHYDLVLIDTAGRFHTKEPLIEELKKMKRTAQKALSSAPHELWMIVDINMGHNIFNQCRLFHEAIGLTGLILTKVDSSARGGGIFKVTRDMALPILYIGTGEKLQDLHPFKAREFLDLLFQKVGERF